MNKGIIIFALVMVACYLGADSVWTGNAAVGDSADFIGISRYFRAASNSFPRGTILAVTNPRGGADTVVEVTGPLKSPGIFLLVEKEAGDAIGLPGDHVFPVRVRPISYGETTRNVSVSVHEEVLTKDIDYNPAASLSDDFLVGEALTDLFTAEVEEEPDAAEIIVPQEDLDESAGTPEIIITYDLTYYLTDDAPPEAEITPKPLPEENDTIFFLTPSELRPPPPVDNGEVIDFQVSAPPAKEEMEVGVPESILVEERNYLEDVSKPEINVPEPILVEVQKGDNRVYIQIGAYQNRTVLEEIAEKIRQDIPGYPLGYFLDSQVEIPVYRLLIGPLRPAETKVVLGAVRSTAFPDAFPYTL